mmetsp:Transcript_22592/g.40773  ORF Transcript_22592/g.40773 Transcript_22592/m.40773 type:complete len:423 (-) Transcript_22592:190-1458(-)|eukprot:CAMPEP_0198283916 /NCGR_PEP_ID=MMETSP1449-20131203/3501_1 /TAXON_ID=420275 /ORGANISM="Attheya septentrionalis, Strain CCMP2084" /LENGTH=422 /DNA_ID=CAMNT_0043980817 /DNA_START=40 /DNA_END=1308 /DNA_ORIENTATION=-
MSLHVSQHVRRRTKKKPQGVLDAIEQTELYKISSRHVPSFDQNEFTVGRRLGVGGFGVVLEIKSFDNDMVKIGHDECHDNIIIEDEDIITEEMDAKIFMSKNAIRNGEARYAIKKLRDDLNEEKRENAVLDLAIESKVLSTLMHPNIVKLRGVASGAPLSPGFFLVMDRLFGTLEERIEKDWRPKYTTPRRLFCGGVQQSQSSDFLIERLFIAYDISSALRFLHNHGIIYRDVKSENVGFDVRGDVKIFDFGLSKQLPRIAKDMNHSGLYKLTGLTGSRMYMAPEVALCKFYGLSADVYSFGILLWEIMSLEFPFRRFDLKDHMIFVVKRGYRPTIGRKWPERVKSIMKKCWAQNPADRPDFMKVSIDLGKALDNKDSKDVLDRSNYMLDRSSESIRSVNNTPERKKSGKYSRSKSLSPAFV